MKILITGANGDIAISICRIIKSKFKKFIIDGVDINPEGLGELYFNNIHKVPLGSDLNYSKKIKKIAGPYNLIIPTTESEIKFFSKKNVLKRKKLLINKKEIIDIFNSKIKTFKFLKKLNLGTPSFCFKLNKIKKYTEPFFIKKDYGYGNRGYRLVSSKEDFKKIKNLKKNEWVAQEYLGKGFNEFTCGIIRLKDFSDVIILKRKLHKGYSYFVKNINNPKLKRELLHLANKINLNGCLNIQLKANKKRYAIFEINTRLSSTVMMRHKLNFKDCVWWMEYLLFNKKPKRNYKIINKALVKLNEEKYI